MIYRHCESQEHFAVKGNLKQSLRALCVILGGKNCRVVAAKTLIVHKHGAKPLEIVLHDVKWSFFVER